MILLVVLSALAFAQPRWISVATGNDAYQYFRYGEGKAIEQERFEPKAGPFDYHFPGPPAPARKVCPIENRAGVYWYTPDGRALSHTFPTPNSSEFTVSAPQTGIRGFAVTAAFAGSAARPGAVEVVYFADRACSDGSVEYGFSRDLASDNILVYWSTFANCGNDANSLCRKTDDGSLGTNFSNVQQEDGGAGAEHGFRIYGLDPGLPYTYKMFTEDRAFRVEVWNGPELARCAESAVAVRAPCSFLKAAGDWFPMEQTGRGYIVAGTQNAGEPGIGVRSVLEVSDIMVAK